MTDPKPAPSRGSASRRARARRRNYVLLLLAVGLVGTLAWWTLRPPSAPNIVLISIDTLRADHLSAYGYHRPTPHMDALANDGTRFLEAHSSAPWTLPSHMSLMTGRYPSGHGVIEDNRTLNPKIESLGEVLSRHGYRCGGFVSHTYLDRRFGFGRGFETYEYHQYVNSLQQPQRSVRGEFTLQRALEYLRSSAHDSRPYLLFVHWFDPHWTYNAPPPFRGKYSSQYQGKAQGTIGTIIRGIDGQRRPLPPEDLQHLIDLYDEEIAYVDHLVGQLVAAVRKMPGGENTVILLTSDHGEEFYEHGSLGHGVTLYREQSHVPLILVNPKEPGPQTVAQVVSNIDIAPTLCRIAGVPAEDSFFQSSEGIPLQAHWQGEGSLSVPIQMETTRWGTPRRAVVEDGYKAIDPCAYEWIGYLFEDGRRAQKTVGRWRRSCEIYHVAKDPQEQNPLTQATPKALASLQSYWQSSWSGVRLKFENAEGWQVALELPDTLKSLESDRWLDEPFVFDGERVEELKFQAGRLSLRQLKTGIEIYLPVSLDAQSQLGIQGIAGTGTVSAGSRSWPLGPGDQVAVPLQPAPAETDATTASGPRVVVEIRAGQGNAPRAELSPEVERVLQSMGYLRKKAATQK